MTASALCRAISPSACAAAAFFAFVLPVPAGAQTSAAAPSAGFRIAGRVVNSVTGEVVPGASVSALDEQGDQVFASVIANPEGRFSIDRVPAGKYPLAASKRGYLTGYYDQHGDFNSAIVTGEGKETENLVFQLTPSAVLRGVITDDGGDPVEGAAVMLFMRPDGGSPSQRVQRINNAITDDTGAYEFSGLSPGEYLVAVQAEPWYARHFRPNPAAVPGPLDVAYPITYFDSTIDEDSAQPIVLDSGAREEADIVLHAVPALHLSLPRENQPRGRFSPAELRQSVLGSQISTGVLPGPGSEGAHTIEFAGLAPGRYEIQQGDPPRILELDASASGEIDPDAGTLAPAVSGALRSTNGSAVPDEIDVALSAVNNDRQALGATAHKSQFRFDAVPPGAWTVSASPRGGAPALSVVAVAAGGAALAGDRITVTDRPLSIAVTVSLSAVRIKGFARKNSKPAPGVMIVLVPRDPNAWPSLARRDQSDSDGSFSLPDVVPGRYTVIAIEDGWKLDWQSRDVIARYLPGGEPVTITDQSGAVVQLAQSVEAVAR